MVSFCSGPILCLGKEPPLSIGYEADRPQDRSGRDGKEKNVCLLAMKSQLSSLQPATTVTELPRFISDDD
jgi:hypothetical protein